MTRFRRRLSTVLVCLASTACHDTAINAPVPVPAFDMERAVASMTPLRQAFEHPLLASLFRASLDFYLWFGVPPVGSLVPSSPSGDPSAMALRDFVPPSGVAASAIPDEAMGTTYVWDAALGRYAPDAGAVGAPPSGIRVVLYTWDPGLGRPVLPLQRTGFADLTEEVSTATTDLLHVRVVGDAGSSVVAEYDWSINSGVGSVTYEIRGSVQNGGLTVGFSAQGVSSATYPLQGSYAAIIAAPSLGVRIYTEQSVSEVNERHLVHSVTYDGHTLLFSSDDSEGEVEHDGRLYATFRSIQQADDSRTNEYLKVDGTVPTAQERAGLESALAGLIVANSFWYTLIWPFR